jgi:hypothetical protein
MVEPKPSIHKETDYSDKVTFMKGQNGGPGKPSCRHPDLVNCHRPTKSLLFIAFRSPQIRFLSTSIQRNVMPGHSNGHLEVI